jgi:hypothetical protein
VTGIAPADGQAVALDRTHDTVAGFHKAALAWAAAQSPGAGPAPVWQSWANRLALALGELAGRAGLTIWPRAPPGRRRRTEMTAWGGQAPGVVKVRISGAPADLAMVTDLLAGAAHVEILTGPDGPYPNRRDAGARVYLTIRTGSAAAGPDQRA